MESANAPLEKKADELTQAIDEYRVRIEQLLRSATEKTRQLADQKSVDIVNTASERAERLVAEGREKARQAAAAIEQQAQQQARRAVDEAERKAAQIVRDAEESAKKEAKERTKQEVEKIARRAREEAAGIAEQVRKEVEKEAREITAKALSEAERLKQETIEDARREGRGEAERIIASSRAEARTISERAVERTKEASAILNDSIVKAEAIIGRLKTEVGEEMEAMSKAITESNKRLVEAMLADSREQEQAKGKEEAARPNGAVPNGRTNGHIINSNEVEVRANRANLDGGRLFLGPMELKAGNYYDPKRIRKLIDGILQVPCVKRTGEYGSEEAGATFCFIITEPLPLLATFTKMPLVLSAVDNGDSIKLLLRP